MTQAPAETSSVAQSISREDTLLEVADLKVHFPVGSAYKFWDKSNSVKAVDGVSFQIRRGETLGLVGESGCGKTTLGRALLRLLDTTTGDVYFDGVNVAKARKKDLKDFRRKAQIIFHDWDRSVTSMSVRPERSQSSSSSPERLSK